MPARLSAFVIWALMAASAAFWGLRLVVRAPSAPAHTVSVGDATPVRADLTRLFGAPPVAAVAQAPTPAIASRFQLTGVMAPRQAGGPGIALIAVDGKMPRAYRVGATIDGELVLQSVSLRSASIGPAQGTPAVVLEVPPLPVAATGTLPPALVMAPPAGGPPPAITLAPVAPAVGPAPPAAMPIVPGGRVAPPQPSRGTSVPPPRETQGVPTQ